jgi:hypothetical protein
MIRSAPDNTLYDSVVEQLTLKVRIQRVPTALAYFSQGFGRTGRKLCGHVKCRGFELGGW